MPELPDWFPIPLYIAGAVGIVTVAVMMRRTRRRPDLSWDEQRVPFWITFAAASVVLVGLVVVIAWPALQAAARGNTAALPATIIVAVAVVAGFYWLILRGMLRTLHKVRGTPRPDSPEH